MTVIYAEKADIGNKIAAALGGFSLPDGTRITFANREKYKDAIEAFQRKQGYLDTTLHGEPCKVTWGYGHMYQLQDVPEYDPTYKTWRNRPVCYIPDPFKIVPKTSSNKGFAATLDRQRKIVKELIHSATRVINATDYDREGELIFAYLCDAIKFKKPFSRVLFVSLTEDGFKEAFDKLIPSAEVKGIELAGRARSIYDWIIGTNLTVRMSTKYPNNGVLSVGRVQTPVLKMLVDRELAIRDFVPKISWNIKGTFRTSDGEYNGLYKGEDMSKADADNILRAINGKRGVVTKCEKKETKQKAPLLYSQTSLQIEASELYGYTAQETLDATQFLYENGYTTYPRTKSQYLTDDMKGVVVKTLKALSSIAEYKPYLDGMSIVPAARYFDSKKVESHFAIIPTGEPVKKSLTPIQKNIYDLIVWSLIRTIYPDAVFEKTSVTTTVDGKYDFATNGSVIIQEGWLAVHGSSKETILPTITLGATYPGTYEGSETRTKPPERYSDASLLKAMETAGKTLDDAEFRAILADQSVNGIGTDATRASIIETLIARGYAERKGKNKRFYATEKGINFIKIIPVPEMTSAEFTARMEQNLSKIEAGELAYESFLKEIFEQTNRWCEIIAEQKNDASTPVNLGGAETTAAAPKAAPKSASTSVGDCPACGKPLFETDKVWRCSDPKCEFHVFRNILSRKITKKEFQTLIKKGETPVLEKFVSKKSGKEFKAKLKLNAAKTGTEFVF